MRYQIADLDILTIEKKSTKRYYMAGTIISLSFSFIFFILAIILYGKTEGTNGYQNNDFLWYLGGVVILVIVFLVSTIGTIFSIRYLIKETKNETILGKIVKFISIQDEGLLVEYFNKQKIFIPYEELEKAHMKVGFTNALGLKVFSTMDDFFLNAWNFIQSVIKKHTNKDIYVVISAWKKDTTPIFELIISLKAVDLKEMIEEWSYKYDSYIKKWGKNNES